MLVPVYANGILFITEERDNHLSFWLNVFVDGIKESVEAIACRVLIVEGDTGTPVYLYSLSDKRIHFKDGRLTRRMQGDKEA